MVTTIAQSSTTLDNVSTLFPDNLKEAQANYGKSCTKYEEKASKQLAKSDMIIVSGYGCALRVKGDALVVFPGKTHAAQKQESQTLYRGVHGISTIILLSDKGLVTLDAVQWCHEQEICVMLIGGRGNVLQSLTPENRSDAKLRRRQYAAMENGTGGIISSELVRRKVLTQLETLQAHSELPEVERSKEIITDALKWFDLPVLPDRFFDVKWLRTYEGRCADAYFGAWKGLPLKWDRTVKKVVPPHWLTVRERSSTLANNARHAIDPVNAILNYAYAILESQCRQALVSRGFDVACGFLHADLLHRDSLVFDLIELSRPLVDEKVLKLVSSTTFTKGDFMSTKDGTVQFNPQLARYIAANCRIEQKIIDGHADWLKQLLLSVD